MSKKIITFVCRGNIVRSPVAEHILNKEFKKRGLDKKYISKSRGVQGTKEDPTPVKHTNFIYYQSIRGSAESALKRLKIDINSHASRVIDKKIVESSDLILAMDSKVQKILKNLFPDQKSKIHLFSELADSEEDVMDLSSNVDKKKQFEIMSYISQTIINGMPKLIKMLD